MAATKYEESVPASWWLSWAIYAVVMGLVVVGGVILFDDGISGASRVLSIIILIGVIVLMVVISLIFTRLHIKVAADSIRFNFGPFGRSVKRGKIAGVDVEPYRWLTYGGWGIRASTKARWAFSVPGCSKGVAIQVLNGLHYHISNKNPRPGSLRDSGVDCPTLIWWAPTTAARHWPARGLKSGKGL